jgi:YidC/Oxa1 family membrane protein insertase
MISHIFHAAFYNPIYNILVALVAGLPGESVGLAVVILTILIRLILLPFTLSAARTQRAMRALEPKLKELKELHKGDKEKEAVATLELYKAERVNPFASLLTLFVQLPILLALYWVFRYEPFTTLDLARLYAFTPLPVHVSLSFLGVSIAGKSIVFAALAGLAQYAQAALALSGQPPSGGGGAQDFQRVLGTQMKYVFPILIAVICYTTSAAVALYFVTTNVIGALQELYVRRKYNRPAVQP